MVRSMLYKEIDLITAPLTMTFDRLQVRRNGRTIADQTHILILRTLSLIAQGCELFASHRNRDARPVHFRLICGRDGGIGLDSLPRSLLPPAVVRAHDSRFFLCSGNCHLRIYPEKNMFAGY